MKVVMLSDVKTLDGYGFQPVFYIKSF